jgi:hypothetical protein
MDRKVDEKEGKDRASEHFSDKGDSGSAVFTKTGVFCMVAWNPGGGADQLYHISGGSGGRHQVHCRRN